MNDPETVDIDETEDPEEAELRLLQEHLSSASIDSPPFDQDGNPVWEQF